ncbi:MAG: CHAT domain-containing protein [Polyangiales bacterium]
MPDTGSFDERETLDLEIHLGAEGPDGHPVTASSDAGDARGTFRLPPTWAGLAGGLRDFLDARLPARDARPVAFDGGAPERPAATARDLGRALFLALFAGRLGRWYDRSRGRAEVGRRPLRLGLRVDDPALAELPWELLFDPDAATDGDHLCLTNVAVVRRLAVLASKDAVKAALPLRILGMAAAPADLPTLDVAGEKAAVGRALAELADAGLVVLKWAEGGTLEALRHELDRGPWHVFHFIGHGRPGALLFTRDGGEGDPVEAAVLAKLLDNHPSLRLAVLNACDGAAGASPAAFSSTAAALVGHGLPAVVAMQAAVTDAAATHFARAFYEAIAARRPLGAAVTLAREAVFSADAEHAEWGAPALFLRAADDRLFDLSAPAAGDRAPGGGAGAWEAQAGDVLALSREIARDPSRPDAYAKRAESYLAASAAAQARDPSRAAWYAELATADLRRAASLGGASPTGAAALRGLAAAAAVVAAEALRGGAAVAADAARVEGVAARHGLLTAPAPLRDVAILWVDDEPASVAGETAALRAMGARVDASGSTEDALARLRAGAYTLVLSDVRRSGNDTAGYELLAAMRAPPDGAPPDPTPVVFYSWPSVRSGETFAEAVERCRAKVRGDHADYACYPQDLIDLVRRAVASRQVVARFEGLTLTLCDGDAGASCFEARSAAGLARYAVDTLAPVEGALPTRERRIVEAWAELRREEIRAADARRRAGGVAGAIAPIA